MISDNELSFKIINACCVEISDNKTNREVNELLIEELSELIKAVIKLERYNFCDNTLRCNYHEIYDNVYEELANKYVSIIGEDKMSVKIDMDMPKSCRDCRFGLFENSKPPRYFCVVEQNTQNVSVENRPSWCPLQ